ncbi:MAG TPA: SDR family oxidoreductase [Bacteroidales bacterium]|nr:SDR family oxidoreductase [Bacteroidales bacterium]
MKNIFKDKVVIITGASFGIGEAIAREFAKKGSKVVLAARSENRLSDIVKEFKKNDYDAIYVRTDVTVEADCRNLIEKTIKKYGKINILINNAGVSMRASFIDVDLKVLHRLMDVNFWGTVYCTKYALPYILEQKGSLVGISSVAGFHGLPGRTGYSASKFAIHGFLETIRIENLKKGLHVMIIAPGFTTTEIRKRALNAKGEEQGESPLNERKLTSPEYVAGWVLKGIRKKKRNKLITLDGKLTALFQRIIPGYIDWAYYKVMSREPESPLE